RGHDGAIPLYADGALFAGSLKAGQTTRQKLDGKPAYLVPARGKIEVRGGDGKPITANARDGVAVVDQDEIEITALEDAEIVLVDADRLACLVPPPPVWGGGWGGGRASTEFRPFLILKFRKSAVGPSPSLPSPV